MANIIIKSRDYQNESAVYNTINYAYSSEYVEYCGAVGVLWYPSLRQCCTDRVLEEDETDFNMNPMLAYIFADQFANYIGQRFQVIYGVHQGSDFSQYYLHIHFVINTVSYVDGNRLYDRRGYYYELGPEAERILPGIAWNVYKN